GAHGGVNRAGASVQRVGSASSTCDCSSTDGGSMDEAQGSGIGRGEAGTGNREPGTGNREQGTGAGNRITGSGRPRGGRRTPANPHPPNGEVPESLQGVADCGSPAARPGAQPSRWRSQSAISGYTFSHAIGAHSNSPWAMSANSSSRLSAER